MAEEFQKSMANVIDHFKNIMTDVSDSYNRAKAEIIELDKYVEIKKREQQEYNGMIAELQQREELITAKEELLRQREEEIKKEQDDGRKVSIIKNIQTQLHHKINELELATKQKEFYRRQCDVLNQLLLKYNITMSCENVSVEQIESIILASKVIETVVPSKIEITCSNTVSADVETEIEKQTDVEAEAEAEAEEQTEVEDFEYRGKMYYIDRSTGDIYAKLEDDDVGDIIGHLETINSKQKVSWIKKQKNKS
jgi:hypothetical protein